MNDHKLHRRAIVNGLTEYLGIPVVMANQTAAVPKRPYVSFTITTPMVTNNGTYGVYKDYSEGKPFKQIWSFTVQAEQPEEADEFVYLAYDWIDNLGAEYLYNNDVIVERVENITNRDTFLTNAYEYRRGFDVVFTFMNVVGPDRGEIKTFSYTYDIKD